MSRDEEREAPDVELSEREEAELAEALVHAYAPKELDATLNERLIHDALEDPLAPPTEEELVESERLRRALEGGQDHPDLDLIRALGSAHREPEASPETRQLVERATRTALAKPDSGKSHATVVYLTFAAVAAAAAVLLFLQLPADRSVARRGEAPAPAAVPAPRLERSRSSEELFHAKFDRGHTSDRIDRIASARARDLRANRFRQWGVK